MIRSSRNSPMYGVKPRDFFWLGMLVVATKGASAASDEEPEVYVACVASES